MMKKRILILALLLLLFVTVFCLSSCGPQYQQEFSFYAPGYIEDDYWAPYAKHLFTATLNDIINGDAKPPYPDCPPGKKLDYYLADVTYYASTFWGPEERNTKIKLFDENLNPAPVEDFLRIWELKEADKSCSVSLWAIYQKAPYSLVFDTKEGKFANGDTSTCSYVYEGHYFALPATPVLHGYTFDGWYNAAGVKIPNDISPLDNFLKPGKYYDLSSAVLNFEARYLPNAYTLTVDLGLEGVENPVHTVYYDGEFPDLSVHYTDTGTREILGWSLEKDTEVDLPDKVFGDITVYPVWKEYKTVDFMLPDGTAHTVKVSSVQEEALVFPELTHPGYKFESWLDGEGNVITDAFYADLADTYWGNWIPVDYAVNFICPAGMTVEPIWHTYGNMTQLPLPTMDGYAFGGWYTDDPENCMYYLPAGLWEDVTLTAKFTPRIYTVNLVAEGVALTERFTTVTYGEDFTVAPPEREGYRFLGWFSAPEGGNPLTDEEGNSLAPWISLAEMTTFYAVWEEINDSEGENS